MHTRDNWLGQALQRQHQMAALFKQLLVVAEGWLCTHLLQVVSSAKSLAFTRQYHDTNAAIDGDGIDLMLQYSHHRLGQGI
jgi:hypothetical protein